MPSPFPGMDPFIEYRGLWSDFHDSLIGEIRRAISAKLPPKYVTRLAERTFNDRVSPDEDERKRQRFVPDVDINRRGPEATSVVAIEPPLSDGGIEMLSLVSYEQRDIYIDIWDIDPDRRLVTSIEVLSPANKRKSGNGWQEYVRKRRLFFSGYANLVEIDLLRSGERHEMESPWPDSPYYLLTSRKHAMPRCEVRPASCVKALPEMIIPLSAPDADLVVPLQPLVDAIYEIAGYAQDIHYALNHDVPLSAEERSLLPVAG